MKRSSIILGLAFTAFLVFSQTGAEAVKPSFADRFAAAAPIGVTGTYGFDKAHSAIGFKVKHNGLIEIPGYFRDFSGSINYNAEDVTKSTVEFTAKASSIDTGNTGRDNHLRSKDFFEIEKFPDVSFKSTKVEKKGKSWMLTGDFTMKGVTKTITFPFSIAGFIPANERRGVVMGFTAETKLKRSEYGITYGTNIPGTSIPTISDDISVRIEVEAPAPRPAAAPAAAAPRTE